MRMWLTWNIDSFDWISTGFQRWSELPGTSNVSMKEFPSFLKLLWQLFIINLFFLSFFCKSQLNSPSPLHLHQVTTVSNRLRKKSFPCITMREKCEMYEVSSLIWFDFFKVKTERKFSDKFSLLYFSYCQAPQSFSPERIDSTYRYILVHSFIKLNRYFDWWWQLLLDWQLTLQSFLGSQW